MLGFNSRIGSWFLLLHWDSKEHWDLLIGDDDESLSSLMVYFLPSNTSRIWSQKIKSCGLPSLWGLSLFQVSCWVPSSARWVWCQWKALYSLSCQICLICDSLSSSIRFWLASLSYNFLLELHLLSQMLWWLPSRFVCMCAKVGTSKWLLWYGWDCDVQDLEAHFVYMWGTFKRQVQFVAQFSKFPWLPLVFSISHWSGINGLVNAFVENSEKQ